MKVFNRLPLTLSIPALVFGLAAPGQQPSSASEPTREQQIQASTLR